MYTKIGHIKIAAYIVLFTILGYIAVNYTHRHEHECCSTDASSNLSDNCYICEIFLSSFDSSNDTHVPNSRIEISNTPEKIYAETLYEIEISVNYLRGPPHFS